MAAENYDTVMRLLADDKMSPEVKKALGNLGQLEKQMVRTAHTSKKSFLEMGYTISRVGRNIAFFGAAVEAPILLATRAAESFEQGMFKVNRTLGKSPAELKSYGDEVKKLSLETGRMPNDLATGLDATLRAGFDAAGALRVTGQGAKLAVGGAIELNDSIKLLTGSMAEYHTQASDVNRVSDQFMMAQKNRTDLTVLAGGMKEIAGQAEAVGVKLPEVLAYITSMEKQGESTGESMENLKTLLSMMGKVPIAKNKGMLAWLNTLGAVSKTNKKAFQLMFESPEQAASIKKTIEGIKSLAIKIDKYKNVNNSGADTNDAFAERSKTLTEQMNKLKTSTNNLGINIGTLLIPAVQKQVEQMTAWVERAINFTEKHPELAGAIANITSEFTKLAVEVGGGLFVLGKMQSMLLGIMKLAPGFIGGAPLIIYLLPLSAPYIINKVNKMTDLGGTPEGEKRNYEFLKKLAGSGLKGSEGAKKRLENWKWEHQNSADDVVMPELKVEGDSFVKQMKKADVLDIKGMNKALDKKAKDEEYVAPIFGMGTESGDMTDALNKNAPIGQPVNNHFNRVEKVELHNVNGIEDLMHELSLIAESA